MLLSGCSNIKDTSIIKDEIKQISDELASKQHQTEDLKYIKAELREKKKSLQTEEDKYTSLLKKWGLLPEYDPVPFNPNSGRFDASYHPYVAPVTYTHKQDSIYFQHRNANTDGKNMHSLLPYSREPYVNSQSGFKVSSERMPTNISSDLDFSEQKYTNTVYDVVATDFDSNFQQEITTFYFKKFSSSHMELRARVTYIKDDQKRLHDIEDDNFNLSSDAATKDFLLYSTNSAPELDGKLKDVTECAYIQVESMDVSADGQDDFLVTQYCGEVKIWRANDIFSSNGSFSLTQTFTHNFYYSNDIEKVSLATGNVDGDPAEELVIAFAEVWTQQGGGSSPYIEMHNIDSQGRSAGKYTRQLEGFTYNSAKSVSASQTSPQDVDISRTYHVELNPSAITIGNIDEDPMNEVIIGGAPWSHPDDDNDQIISQDNVGVVYWDPSNSHNDFHHGSWGSETAFFTLNPGTWGWGRNVATDIGVWDPFGWGSNKLIYFGDKLFQLPLESEDQDSQMYVVENGLAKEKNSGIFRSAFSIGNYALMDLVAIEGVVGEQSDIIDDAREELFILPFTMLHDKAGDDRLYHTETSKPSFLVAVHDEWYYSHQTPEILPLNGGWFTFGEVYLKNNDKLDWHIPQAFAQHNDPRPITIDFTGQRMALEYEGIEEHSIGFSDPLIQGLFTLPPFHDDSSGSEKASVSIGFKSTSKDSLAISEGYSWQIKAGIKYKNKLDKLNNKFLGSNDFEVVFKGLNKASTITTSENYTYSTSEYTFTETSTNGIHDHTLLLSVVPYDLFAYSVKNASDPDDIGKSIQVMSPRAPQLTMMEVSKYNDTVANSSELDDQYNLPFNVADFTSSTVGDPASYPSIESYRQRLDDDDYDVIYAVSEGTSVANMDTTQAITKGEGASESTKISQAYGAEFGVVLGRAAIDMRHMYENAKDIKVTIEDSSTIKASVPALNYNEGFAPYVWGLHGYLEQTTSTEGDGNQLLVIDHWVSY